MSQVERPRYKTNSFYPIVFFYNHTMIILFLQKMILNLKIQGAYSNNYSFHPESIHISWKNFSEIHICLFQIKRAILNMFLQAQYNCYGENE